MKTFCKILLIFLVFAAIIYFLIPIFINWANTQYTSNAIVVPYYIGGIFSGIFAALAFIGLLVTLFYQIKQTKTTDKTSRIQRFESTLYNMIDLQQSITNELSYTYQYWTPEQDNKPAEKVTRVIKGRSLFTHIFTTEWIHLYHSELIGNAYAQYVQAGKIFPEGINECDHSDAYICFMNTLGLKAVLEFVGLDGYNNAKESLVFDHYFRHLYRILKHIDNAEFLDKKDDITERYKYAANLRATLSPYELIMLFYNGLSERGEKLKPLLERYAMLKNIRKDLLPRGSQCSSKRIEMGITDSNTFPVNDYDYFTDIKSTQDKFSLNAFYSTKDIKKAIEERLEQQS
ncbi:putative phage abortive infection protein [Alistipes indistinctus]|jgi:uncharacterized membrane protein